MRFVNGREKLVDAERLPDVEAEPVLFGELAGMCRGRDEDDSETLARIPESVEDLRTVHHRHSPVEEHDAGLELGEYLERLTPVSRLAYIPALRCEHVHEARTQVVVVVDHQHPAR